MPETASELLAFLLVLGSYLLVAMLPVYLLGELFGVDPFASGLIWILAVPLAVFLYHRQMAANRKRRESGGN